MQLSVELLPFFQLSWIMLIWTFVYVFVCPLRAGCTRLLSDEASPWWMTSGHNCPTLSSSTSWAMCRAKDVLYIWIPLCAALNQGPVSKEDRAFWLLSASPPTLSPLLHLGLAHTRSLFHMPANGTHQPSASLHNGAKSSMEPTCCTLTPTGGFSSCNQSPASSEREQRAACGSSILLT